MQMSSGSWEKKTPFPCVRWVCKWAPLKRSRSSAHEDSNLESRYALFGSLLINVWKVHKRCTIVCVLVWFDTGAAATFYTKSVCIDLFVFFVSILSFFYFFGNVKFALFAKVLLFGLFSSLFCTLHNRDKEKGLGVGNFIWFQFCHFDWLRKIWGLWDKFTYI